MEPTMEVGVEPAGGMKTVSGLVVQIDEGGFGSTWVK